YREIEIGLNGVDLTEIEVFEEHFGAKFESAGVGRIRETNQSTCHSCLLHRTGMGAQCAARRPGTGIRGRRSGGPADYLKGCKVAPEGRGGGGRGPGRGPAAPATFDAREYTVTEIPGVITAGAKWTEVWHGDGNNADGLIGTNDGGVLFAQHDNNMDGKIVKYGNVTFITRA